MSLRLWKNNRLIANKQFQIKDRLLRSAQVEMWNKAYLKVNYGGNKTFNDGIYFNYECLKFALSSFTEKVLISYLSDERIL